MNFLLENRLVAKERADEPEAPGVVPAVAPNAAPAVAEAVQNPQQETQAAVAAATEGATSNNEEPAAENPAPESTSQQQTSSVAPGPSFAQQTSKSQQVGVGMRAKWLLHNTRTFLGRIWNGWPSTTKKFNKVYGYLENVPVLGIPLRLLGTVTGKVNTTMDNVFKFDRSSRMKFKSYMEYVNDQLGTDNKSE